MPSPPALAKLLTDQDATLDSLLAAANSICEVCFESVSLGGVDVEVLQIVDMPAYVDHLAARATDGKPLHLPFWAKLWPAALPMAMLLSRTPELPKNLLEVGAGVGLCGLAAAKRGVPSLITDIEPEAVLFIRAAIVKNGLSQSARAEVVDFTATRLPERFDTVAASEALYLPQTHTGLLDFLTAHLSDSPTAQALLSCDDVRRPDAFMRLAAPTFRIQRMGASRTDSDGNVQPSTIYRLRRHA